METSVIITAIICITIVLVSYINKDKGGKK